MTRYRRKITKELYDRAMLNKGILTEEDQKSVFSASEMFGYCVYVSNVVVDHGEYYVTFTLGSSCD